MNVQAAATLKAPSHTSWHKFGRHFLEMVAAMVAGMAILGGALSLGFALFGHGNPVHYAGLRALVMTVNMTIGMALWMHYRRHAREEIAEMAGAMFVPLAILIGPYWAGLLSGGVLLSVMHLLMLPAMLFVMFRRWDVYAADHRSHAEGGRAPDPRSVGGVGSPGDRHRLGT